MKYFIFTAILCGFFSYSLYAQGMDSLWSILKKSNPDTYEPILTKIEKTIENQSLEKKYENTLKTIEISQTLPFANAHSMSYLILARLYFKHDSADKSIITAKKGYEIAQKNTLFLETAKIGEYLAFLYAIVGNQTAAMGYVLESQNIYKKLGMRSKSFNMLYIVASACYNIESYDEVITYLGDLTEKDFENQQPRAVINTINLLGLTYRKKKQYEKAILHFNKAIEKAKQYNDTVWVGILQGNIGDVYNDQGLHAIAKPYLRKDVEISLIYKEYSNAAISIMRIGEGELKENNPKTALTLFDSALKVMQKDVHFKDAMEHEKYMLYQNLSQACEKMNMMDKALYYYKESYRFRDSLQKKKKEVELKKLQINFDFNQKVTIINERNKEREKAQKKITTLAIIIAGLLSIIILILFSFFYRQKKLNRHIQKQNAVIEEYNNQLEEQVSQRTAELKQKNQELLTINQQLESFAYIIAHNLRAPVASILGLKSIFDETNFDTPDNRYIIEKVFESATRLEETINDLNLILKVRRTIDEIKEPINLDLEVEKALFALKNEIEKSKIVVQNEVNKNVLVLGIKPYVQSIFFNLISNSIKYRDTQKERSFILIRSREKENVIEFEIEDNGLGMDISKGADKIFALYKRMHSDVHIEGKGIGLYLVKTQIEVMKGTISVESEPYKGTKFIIQLPKA
jgi:signal transduction histidine kinase